MMETGLSKDKFSIVTLLACCNQFNTTKVALNVVFELETQVETPADLSKDKFLLNLKERMAVGTQRLN